MNIDYQQLTITYDRFKVKEQVSSFTQGEYYYDYVLNDMVYTISATELELYISKHYSRINNSYNIKTPCGLNIRDINAVLRATPFQSMGDIFLLAEMKSGVNAIVLVALAQIESDLGNSILAVKQNNVFNWNDNYYKSFEDCIMSVSNEIRESNYQLSTNKNKVDIDSLYNQCVNYLNILR